MISLPPNSLAPSMQALPLEMGNAPASITSNNLGSKFANVMQSIDTGLQKVENLLSSKVLNPQELLKAQMQIHKLGISAEMVSKITESATSSIKKLQSQAG